jgi:hypothetical protein
MRFSVVMTGTASENFGVLPALHTLVWAVRKPPALASMGVPASDWLLHLLLCTRTNGRVSTVAFVS